MARAPIQIIVIPYRRRPGCDWEFAVFQRADENAWQFIAGGAEGNESPLEAAQREACEEAGIPHRLLVQELDSKASIPRCAFPQATHWPHELHVVPEHSFAVDVGATPLALSDEHRDQRWLSYGEAMSLLRWDSNRTALWELNERLSQKT